MRRLVLILTILLYPHLVFGQHTYNTSFPTVQNPISEGGVWTNGLTTGLAWQNVQVLGSPNHATGTTVNNPPPFDDSTAVLTNVTWSQNQTACGIVYVNGITATSPHHEIELRLNTTITANSITGYEFNFSVGRDGAQYAQIVRWNGPSGNFTVLANASGPPGIVNGDKVCASRSGGTLSATINNVAVVGDTAADSTYLGGSPGMGFWNRGVVGDFANFGFSSFTASDGPAGNIINAASCSTADVQSALNSVTLDNTTVNIPAGTCTYTSGVVYTLPSTITKLKIVGAGTSNIGTGCENTLTSCGANASTTTLVANTSGNYNPILAFTMNSSQILELGQLQVNPQSGATSLTTPIGVQGQCSTTTCSQVNIHDITFGTGSTPWDEGTQCASTAFCTWMIRVNNVIGVIHHNTIPSPAGQSILVNANHANQFPGLSNPGGQYGDTSWAIATTFGTANELYLEDNLITVLNVEGMTDCDIGDGTLTDIGGCRIAVRHNRVSCTGSLSCTGVGTNHGTDSTGRPRGGRSTEGYNNRLSCGTSSFCNQMFGFRSGVGIIHDNILDATGSGANALIQLQLFRTVAHYTPFGSCDGEGPWDTNDGITYFSGTAQAGSSTDHLVGSGFNITLNTAGAPYSVINVTQGWGSEIRANTTTTIDSGAGVNGQTHPWNVGDSYTVKRATVCIDQEGRGPGVLLSGTSPTPVGPVNQTLDPTYEWNDQIANGGFFHGLVSSGTGKLLANRDYYAEFLNGTTGTQGAQTSPSAPFNGTTTCVGGFQCGVGWGSLSNRPATCTPTVGYYDTGANVLYKCLTANTWTATYTPFTYPHPLITGGGGGGVTPPGAPSSLTATASGSTINLSWTAPTGALTGYTIYRGTTSGGPYNTVVKSGLTTTSFADAGLANGTYFYVVTAFNGGVVSSISGNGSVATVTCAANCTFPTNSSVNIQGNSVAAFNGIFTVTGQPSANTFTYASSTNNVGTGGGAWISGAESARSNQASATVGAALTISLVPASQSFPSTTVGTSTPSQRTTLTNSSAAGNSVTVSSISVTGTNSGDFTATNNCIGTLVSGQFCFIDITFTPTLAGARSASVSVFDNAAGSPQTVPLTGTGVSAGPPAISLLPSPVNFNSQLTSTTSAVLTVTMSNAQGGPVTLDIYGGRTDITCTSTGWFHTQKLGNRWWLCDPLGNVFYAQMMNGVIPIDSTASATITAKYGSTIAWTSQANNRLKSWNFNSLTTNTYLYNLPIGTDPGFPVDSNGVRSQPVKMPFTLEVRPANYAMHNTAVCAAPFLTAPVKNMYGSVSPFFPFGAPSGGVADYYDAGVVNWLNGDLTSGCDFTITTFNNSKYQNYLIGWFADDSDEMNGFGAGPDFPTQPTGRNNAHLGMQVATLSPIQTAYSTFGFVYPDTLIHSKQQLRNSLATEYTTVAALNTAWTSSYTTFDSSGTCVGTQPITCASSVAADSVGTGNGTTLTFTKTLSHTTISAHSLQVLVAGTAVAGDTGSSTLFGPNASGTINYSTGALSITFTAGNAPVNGAAITATYIANGWGIGTGFMDEDNRVSHNSYMGTDWIGMSSANATVLADLNNFLQAIAGKYFNDCRTQLKAVYPNLMFLGPDSLTTWSTPSAAPVLKAAGLYIDAFVTGSSVVFSQTQMNYIETNYGDKPYIGSFYSNANPDSALSQFTGNPAPTGFATQAARGSQYQSMVTSQIQSSQTTAGNFPYVGTYWWEYFDNWGEQLNWGIVTHLDNAYDGREPATGVVACSAPLQVFNCGSEPVPPSGGGTPPFGNLVSPVKTANALWLANNGGSPQVLATPYFTITGTNSGDFSNTGAGSCANGLTVNAGSSCTVTLTFSPSATGARIATLNIFGTTNITDALTGTGITSKCAFVNQGTLSGAMTVCGP